METLNAFSVRKASAVHAFSPVFPRAIFRVKLDPIPVNYWREIDAAILYVGHNGYVRFVVLRKLRLDYDNRWKAGVASGVGACFAPLHSGPQVSRVSRREFPGSGINSVRVKLDKREPLLELGPREDANVRCNVDEFHHFVGVNGWSMIIENLVVFVCT